METPIVVAGKRIGKWRASFLLCKETFRFISADKEMLAVPIITGFAQFFLIGVVILIMIANGYSFASLEEERPLTGVEYLYMFFLYVVSAFTVAYAQATITHIVYTRMHDGDATLRQGLAVAMRHAPALFVWAIISSTVGIILRTIAERSQLLMKIVVALIGATWSVLTYFVVSAIVIDHKAPFDAIRHSGSVFRRTWGETLVTNFSLGLVFTLVIVVFAVALTGLYMIMGSGGGMFILCLLLFFLGLLLIILVSSVLNSVLRTLLYVYATSGKVPANFNAELLEHMLSRKEGVLQSGSGDVQ